MMGPGYFTAVFLVARQAVGLILRTRKTVFLLLLAVVYCGIIALVLSRAHERARIGSRKPAGLFSPAATGPSGS